jgi:predicted patatin/cPLA2 family phospholipase
MEKCLAFVLGGGGVRGALQVGALRALFEANYQPDLLVGISIGAANAAGLVEIAPFRLALIDVPFGKTSDFNKSGVLYP